MMATLPKARFEASKYKPPGQWLLDEIPWSEAKHIIKVTDADARLAKKLDMTNGAPCLVLTPQTWQGGRRVTFVDVTHPGERYQFAGTFRPRANL